MHLKEPRKTRMRVNKMVTAGSETQNGTEEESSLLRQTASQRGEEKTRLH